MRLGGAALAPYRLRNFLSTRTRKFVGVLVGMASRSGFAVFNGLCAFGKTVSPALSKRAHCLCFPGRTLTIEDTKAGGCIDLGGQWISHTSHRRLLALARDLGVEIYDQHDEGLEIMDAGSGGVKSYTGLIPPMSLFACVFSSFLHSVMVF